MKERYEKYREIIVYLITGVLTTILNWACYGLGVSVFHWPVFVSNLIAWIAAVIFAYVTNKIYVFRSRNWNPGFVVREAAMFTSGRIVTGVFEIVAVPLLVSLGLRQPVFGVEGMFAKVLVSVIVTILNYVFSKMIVFRYK